MQILFLIFMFVLGAIFGSFLCCQARRIHGRVTRQLRAKDIHRRVTDLEGTSDRVVGKHGRVTRAEGDPRGALATWGRKARGRTRPEDLPNRSVCLHCYRRLTWYDNIPILSWFFLRGKCRNCHKPIGLAEIISEVALALSFLALGTYFLTSHSSLSQGLLSDFPIISLMDWAVFIATLLFTLSLAFLAIYDGLYGELPSFALTISAICAIILTILQVGNYFLVAGFFDINTLWQKLTPPLLAAALFGGIYLTLYLVSRGKWVGDGDWILAAIIGLALGHPLLAVSSLFIANLTACLITLPTIKKRKTHQIYFGPFLALSYILTLIFSPIILNML